MKTQVSIDKTQWFKDVFAEVLSKEDIIRQPLLDYLTLSDKEKDKLRQTQIFSKEIVQVLGHHESFSLIRKYDQTLGWVLQTSLTRTQKTALEIPRFENCTSLEFINFWRGRSYIFGGLSEEGIDCSGYTQMYYLQVHGLLLPKNSHDQRKLGIASSLDEMKNHDLIFCRPLSNLEAHHVALIYDNEIWHSRRKYGVAKQNKEEFLKEFKVEDVRRYQ